ncbi:hypothetical protein KKF82_07820 [Patescibacteria group bacterium]|nr:hypothetical protein [Patescibacteria group bacterium]
MILIFNLYNDYEARYASSPYLKYGVFATPTPTDDNFEVIGLMIDNLPRDKPKWQIIPTDMYWYLDHRAKCQKYDTVVLDIWWGRGSIQIGMEMMVATAKTKYALPDAKLMIWGHRDPEINPAVTKEITMCEEELIKT